MRVCTRACVYAATAIFQYTVGVTCDDGFVVSIKVVGVCVFSPGVMGHQNRQSHVTVLRIQYVFKDQEL